MLTASLVLFLYLSLAVIEHDIPTLRQWVNVERQATLLQIKSSAITAFLYFIHIVLPHGKNACTFVTTTWCHLEFVLGAAVLLRDGVCQWEGSVVENDDQSPKSKLRRKADLSTTQKAHMMTPHTRPPMHLGPNRGAACPLDGERSGLILEDGH